MKPQNTLLLNPNPNDLYSKWKDTVDKPMRIYTWTTGKELAFLCEYATYNSHIIEIGSYVGRSAKCMFLANPKLHITTLDTMDDEGTKEELYFNLREERNVGETNRHFAIQGPSHDSLKRLALSSPLSPFTGAFIDGGHLYDDVRGDIEGVRALLPEGSIICGHDYRHDLPEDGVTKAVNEAFPNASFLPGESIWIATL